MKDTENHMKHTEYKLKRIRWNTMNPKLKHNKGKMYTLSNVWDTYMHQMKDTEYRWKTLKTTWNTLNTSWNTIKVRCTHYRTYDEMYIRIRWKTLKTTWNTASSAHVRTRWNTLELVWCPMAFMTFFLTTTHTYTHTALSRPPAPAPSTRAWKDHHTSDTAQPTRSGRNNCKVLQHAATNCSSTLQHIANRCNSLQRTHAVLQQHDTQRPSCHTTALVTTKKCKIFLTDRNASTYNLRSVKHIWIYIL